jgi:hypothetical protein
LAFSRPEDAGGLMTTAPEADQSMAADPSTEDFDPLPFK